jgi:hypothetical protein
VGYIPNPHYSRSKTPGESRKAATPLQHKRLAMAADKGGIEAARAARIQVCVDTGSTCMLTMACVCVGGGGGSWKMCPRGVACLVAAWCFDGGGESAVIVYGWFYPLVCVGVFRGRSVGYEAKRGAGSRRQYVPPACTRCWLWQQTREGLKQHMQHASRCVPVCRGVGGYVP